MESGVFGSLKNPNPISAENLKLLPKSQTYSTTTLTISTRTSAKLGQLGGLNDRLSCQSHCFWAEMEQLEVFGLPVCVLTPDHCPVLSAREPRCRRPQQGRMDMNISSSLFSSKPTVLLSIVNFTQALCLGSACLSVFNL